MAHFSKLREFTADINNTYIYNGVQSPAPTVTVGPETLTAGTDYTLTYEKKNNDNWVPVPDAFDIGTYKVTVTGIGTYKGWAACKGFVINPKSVTITAKDKSGVYNGEILRESGFTTTALEEGDTHTFTVEMTDESKITDAGSKANVIAKVDGVSVQTGVETEAGNYLVTTAEGELKVKPGPVTITAQDKAFTYDGEAHSWPGYDVTGLVGGDKIEAAITGSITSPDDSPVVNKVASYNFTAGNPGNYTVKTTDGKLTMAYGPVVTVTFDSNNCSGKKSTQDCYKGVSAKLKKNEFTYAGHAFKNWNTKADGKGTDYADEESIRPEDDMTLYAQWEENENYSVTVKTDKNGTASADPSSAPAGTKIKLTAKSKAGYKFKKWTSSDGVKFAKAASATTTFDMPDKNVTVKANFEKINITPIVTMKSNGKTKMDIAWKKIKEANGYDVFFEKCNSKNEKKEPKRIATIKNNKTTKYTVSKIRNSKNKKESLKAKTSYKAYVRPFVWKDSKKKSKVYIGKSPLMHAYTSGGSKSVTNAKSITIRNKEIKKDKVTIAKGKTLILDVGINYVDSKKEPFPDSHVTTLRYLSTNKNIATVSTTGKNKAKNTVKITAKKKGNCTIYVYAHNGVNKAIKVTVR
ncbi:MAG: InlB B-repeat-containing protein [Lachnospiraceae bacterium]|nr:InlB B-repeat-containing protein [Lachnospiraceae bacterium]